MNIQTFSIKSEAELQKIAKHITSKETNDKIFLLSGDLGAGKTTLVRSICKELNIDGNEITSPTYLGAAIYVSNNSQISHLDLYRYDCSKAADQLVSEYLEYSHLPMFIEWPERISKKLLSYLKKKYKIIHVNILVESILSRLIQIHEINN